MGPRKLQPNDISLYEQWRVKLIWLDVQFSNGQFSYLVIKMPLLFQNAGINDFEDFRFRSIVYF